MYKVTHRRRNSCKYWAIIGDQSQLLACEFLPSKMIVALCGMNLEFTLFVFIGPHIFFNIRVCAYQGRA